MVAALIVVCATAAPGQVVINEIMYHPYQLYPVITNETEYIEIYNAGTGTVNLAEDYRFDNGVDFNFPAGTMLGPGQYLVIVENEQAFSNAYPAVVNFVGNYNGGLSDSTERITLSRRENGSWVTEDTIKYVDLDGSDGEGGSLELINPGFARLRNHAHGSWAVSRAPWPTGSPGAINSVFDSNPPPVIGDVIHDPPVPLGNSAVTISARVTSRDTELMSAVKLMYRISNNPHIAWSETDMYDNGLTAGDEVAGDGVHTAMLPPYGGSYYGNGTTLEFMIKATDANALISYAPSTNTAGVALTNCNFTYLVHFDVDSYSDCAYPGEYPTYRILMTESNRFHPGVGLEVRGRAVDTLLDCTFITDKGDIYYNCGVRYRGDSSRFTGESFRIVLPAGAQVDGESKLSFNHQRALNAFMGMTMLRRAGEVAADVELSRIYLNGEHKVPATHGVHLKLEKFSRAYLDNHFPGADFGNFYRGDPLAYYASTSSYDTVTRRRIINDPNTAWLDLQNLGQKIDSITLPQGFPTSGPSDGPLTNVADKLGTVAEIKQWGRHYAYHVCINDTETSLVCPNGLANDEDYAIYGNPITKKFEFLPWDYDDIVVTPGAKVWNYFNAGFPVRKYLYNPPIFPYYIGDCADIITNVFSDAGLDQLFLEMGSKATTTYKNDVRTRIAGYRTDITNQIGVHTNFIVVAEGAVATGPNTVVLTNIAVEYQDKPTYLEDVDQAAATNGFVWPTDVGKYRWVSLGSYDFVASGTEYVRVIRDNPDGAERTVADSIRWSNSLHVVTLDNQTSGMGSGTVTSNGVWNNFNWDVGKSLIYSVDNGASCTFTPILPEAGNYEVYASIPFHAVLPPDPLSDYRVMVQDPYYYGSVSFTGACPQAYVHNVIVKGGTTVGSTLTHSHNASSEWQTTNIVRFVNGVGTAVVAAVDFYGVVQDTKQMNIICRQDQVNYNGPITTNSTWQWAVVVDDNITIDSGATLTVLPNTVIMIAPGKSITVNSGAIDFQGTEEAPIDVYPYGGNQPWSLIINGAGSSVTSTYVNYFGGDITANSADSAIFDKCHFKFFDKNLFDNTQTLFDGCLIEDMSECGLIFTNSGTIATVRRTTIRDASPYKTPDGIRFTAGSGGAVTNCEVSRIPGSAIVVDNSSAADVSQSLIYLCGTGITVTASAASTNWNNTITECARGIVGLTAVVSDSILWNNTNSLAGGPATVSYCDVELAVTNSYPGTENLNRDPWFRDPVPEEDFRLLPISPCLNSDSDGDDRGAVYPTGCRPIAPTGLILTNVTGTSIELQWNDNSSDERWFRIERSRDGATWSELALVSTNVIVYTDYDVAANQRYYYRVAAVHDRGRSLWTDEPGVTSTYADLVDALRITEIMYNPDDSDMREFLELKNISGVTLDLSGLAFDTGVTLDFTNGTTLGAGQFLVFVRDEAGFTARYPAVDYDGVFYQSALNNGGEPIRLVDSNTNEIIKLTYNDNWYETTDGGGYSLVPVDPNPAQQVTGGTQDDLSYWRASANLMGSPGEDDPEASYGTILINELMTHADPPYEDAIELYNYGTNTVDISGWYLSDNAGDFRRWQIPTNSPLNIAPGGYHVFYESTSFGVNFGMSELGETLYLSSSDGTNLTSYRTSQGFGAAEKNVAFGRHINSDGDIDFVAMSTNTFGVSNPSSTTQFRTGTGETNAYPKVGPVVISEIMYNPAPKAEEFIELHNISGGDLPLFDPAEPTNTWRLRSAVKYDFETNVTLTADEYVLVVDEDPEVFRAKAGITNGCRIFGPYSGNLANNGESVRLYKPNDPEIGGFVPYVLADRVSYNDKLPWPETADGDGPSLEKSVLSGYGNDPANWVASTGGGTPGAANNFAGLSSVGFARAGDKAIETNYIVQVEVKRWPVSASSTVTVSYVVGGSATADSDFVCTNGALVFWPHDTVKTIPLEILDDATVNETNETVTISLTGLSANAVMGGNHTYTFKIVDTDTGAIAAPTIVPAGSTFEKSVDVSLVPPVSTADIYYTLDGTAPTTDDMQYTGNVHIVSSVRLMARSYLGDYNAGSYSTADFQELTPQPPATLTASDDADEDSVGTVTVGERFLLLGQAGYWGSGLRFPLNIPQGATITNAYIQFTAADINSGAVSLEIFSELTDDSLRFTNSIADISSRPRSTTSVTWSPGQWFVSEERGPKQRTPNIASVLQEVVDRPGWEAGNHASVIITNLPSADFRKPWSFESDPTKVPVLHYEYVTIPPGASFPAATRADRFTQNFSKLVTGGTAVTDFSGACVDPDTGNLMVVCRSPGPEYWVQVIDPSDGSFVKEIHLEGFNDTEGICPYKPENNQFAIADEYDNFYSNFIVIVTIDPGTTNIVRGACDDIMVLFPNDTYLNKGIEGVSYDPNRDCFYVVQEKFASGKGKRGIYKVSGSFDNPTTEAMFDNDVTFAGITDLSEVFYDPYTEHLFALSDENNMVIETDLQGNVIATKSISGFQPEGLCFSADRREMYLISEPNEYYRLALTNSLPGGMVDEGAILEVNVALSWGWLDQVTVGYVITSSTAVAEVDYTPSSGTLVFDSGSTVEPISINIATNKSVSDQDLTIILTNASVASIVWDYVYEYTIRAGYVPSATSNEVPLGWITNRFPGVSTEEQANAIELLDQDNDGMLTYQEYRSGTDPTNSASVFGVNVVFSNGTYVLYFPTILPVGPWYTDPGQDERSYGLEQRTNLLLGGWQPVPDPDYTNTPATGDDVVYTNVNGRIYYRAKAWLH